MNTPNDILHFWFAGDPSAQRADWFRESAAFDAACRDFMEAHEAAKRGDLDAWSDTGEGALALLILLDQLSRNLHRGSPETFAADAKARAIASAAIERGFDRALTPVQRSFVYLPFEHSEDLADQDRSVALFDSIRGDVGDITADYAARHRDVIARFGRFPHRNAVLGRTNTPAEEAYLAEPGAGFRPPLSRMRSGSLPSTRNPCYSPPHRQAARR
jgi:uncharacterized protein (DUF924 family)